MCASSVAGRHARLLQILSHLQSGSGLNASRLAGELAVCRRTIFRDLRLMRAAGIEIHFDEEMKCYRLQSRRDLMVMPTLEHEELTSLLTAVHFSILRHLPTWSDVLRQSTNKLLAHSPYQVQHHATRLISSCSLQWGSDSCSERVDVVIHQVLEAISRRRVLRLKLQDGGWNREVTTHFAPYQVIAGTESWQIIGKSSHHQAVRTLDPCQIQSTQMTEEIYAVPRQYQSRS